MLVGKCERPEGKKGGRTDVRKELRSVKPQSRSPAAAGGIAVPMSLVVPFKFSDADSLSGN